MFCEKCGNEIKENTQFCSKCGKKINTTTDKKVSTKSKNFLKGFNSKLAFIFGVLLIFPGYQDVSYFVAGISIILGTVAYKSVKNKTTDKKTLIIKRVVEITFLILIFVIIGLQNNVSILAIENPVVYGVIPAWILTAYLVALLGNRFKQNKKKRIAIIAAIFISIFIIIASTFSSILAYSNSTSENTTVTLDDKVLWKSFSPETKSFSVLLPTEPSYEFNTYAYENDPENYYDQELYKSSFGDNLFVIKKLSYSLPAGTIINAKDELDFMVEYLIQSTPGAMLISSKFTPRNKDSIVDFTANNNEGVYIKGRLILTDQVIYQLYSYSTNSGNDNYNKFINSFEYTE